MHRYVDGGTRPPTRARGSTATRHDAASARRRDRVVAVHPGSRDGVHAERGETERDEDHRNLTPTVGRETFQCTVDALGLVRVVVDRGDEQEHTDEPEDGAAGDVADPG